MVRPLLLPEAEQDLDDLLDDRRLDALGRLVEQEQLGLAAEAARQRQDLLLAARQRAAGAVQDGFSRGNVVEDLVEHVVAAGRRWPRPMRRLSRTDRPGKICRPCGT